MAKAKFNLGKISPKPDAGVMVLSIFLIHRICHLECHFNTIVAVCDGCHA